MAIEGGLGAGYCVTEGVEAYVNANVAKGDNYRNVSGNIGIKYLF
jgi:outer membrane autotransporter protein